MSETGTSGNSSGTSSRKRYASTKTAAQIWTGRAIIAGILGFVGLMLYNFGFGIYLLFAPPKSEGPLIWASADGIGFSKGGGERTGTFKLPGSTGESVANPRYTVVGDRFVYYDPQGKSLCVLTPSESPRWVSLEHVIGENKVRDVRPVGTNGVLVVAYSATADDAALPPVAAVARYTFGAPDASLADPQDVRFDAEGKRSVVAPSGKIVSWDYDFGTSTMVDSQGKAVTVNQGGQGRTFGLGVLYFIRHVSATAKPSEVWMTAVKPFKSGHVVVAFDHMGSFQGVMLKDKGDIRPPFVKPTPELVDLLTRVAGSAE